MSTFKISGQIVDVIHKTIFPGTITIAQGRIQSIEQEPKQSYQQYILPGFIDAHVHIESSMLVPTEFARIATVHGTVGAVCDPHEIANVLGMAGVEFMLTNATQTLFKIAFGAPSCVPATTFETAGANLTAMEIKQLFQHPGISYLSEVMNVPGVLGNNTEVISKIDLAKKLGYPIDGHAPGLSGQDLQKYADANITTDHECSTLEEALDKIAVGMKILIREGSAAKNYLALHSLIDSHPDQCMFCSDDLHPDDLVRGHINELVRHSLILGHDVMNVLQIACVNPVRHYNLNVGLLQVADPADFIVVNNLEEFTVQCTYCQGVLVAKEGQALLPYVPALFVNNFTAKPKQASDFRIVAAGSTVRVIEVWDGQLLTTEKHILANIENGEVVADLENDILKIAVVNRYQNRPPAMGLIHNFGLQRGAIASSVAHDSHNIVAVGTTDEEISRAVNAVIQAQGGIAVVEGKTVKALPLPVAGLMSGDDGYTVAEEYGQLDALAKDLGSKLSAPFMTLGFMALLVIPELKLSDQGLFSSNNFEFVSLWV
ncbi:adenine deaminase [Anabaenopsis tanganyikae CS-531]|uniref:Adenine deaminase n=2 Tax=Anabaenopsis TaxID=110103 RepID=A0ABT6KFR3_9CYAN|nr:MULTISPECIES: adenine deaminase [Anabaenopsis]MDB9540388.1 adenine deaminase [Anabaenopsis arnoldii]MDH6092786.1 adenine deaminase [Anabaenopsis arnoldii]MDH6106722.1 adenine deaminase [Anabaenopsis tanganyikae CS-531]